MHNTQDSRLKIGVLTGRTPYPNGLAAAQRIHLMARAMAEAGASVRVWVDGLDDWTDIRNREPVGETDHVPFEYLLPRTVANPHKARRVVDRLTMIQRARRMIARNARHQDLSALYLYGPVQRWSLERLTTPHACRRHGIPVVMDLCEAPWSLTGARALIERSLSPLWCIDGVLSISQFLHQWAQEENAAIGGHVQSLYVPILVDVDEFAEPAAPAPGKTVLFAGSPQYYETIRFLLEAMETVWARHPDCRLVVTGGATTHQFDISDSSARTRHIEFPGYLSRPELVRAYAAASVLTVPLFDDIASRARFPTKLGEYLASGRPVVTTRVGEIPRYLEDGVNALTVAPGDRRAHGEAIASLLDDPARGHAMGSIGRRTAERHFQYAQFGPALCEFFARMRSIMVPPPLQTPQNDARERL